MAGIKDKDQARLVALYRMVEKASKADADAHTKNEAMNAMPVLFQLLGKLGLSMADMPELVRQHEAREATKAGTTANAAPAQDDQPALIELIEHVLKSYIDVQPHEYTGIALWILATHVFDHFQISPRLAALSPVRGCGKTKLLMLPP